MNAVRSVRIVVVDDHQVVRDGIIYNLSSVDDMVVIGEAASGLEAIKVCAELEPDVVIMDMKMPEMNGIQATEIIREKHENTKVIVLTTFCEPAMIRRVLDAGALSILMKDTMGTELIAAIRSAVLNQPVLNPMVVRALVPASQQGYVNIEELTAREFDVLTLIANGQSNEEIADSLYISRNTVRYHVRSILGKFGAENRTEAVSIALRSGLIE